MRSGVKIVEYKIPTVDAQLRTIGMKSVENKTIYDPLIWTDGKLENSLKEAIQDALNENGGVLKPTWDGVSKDGFAIRGYYRDGKISTFYFE